MVLLLLLLLLLTIFDIFLGLLVFFDWAWRCFWLMLLWLLLILPEQLDEEKDRRQFGHVVHRTLVAAAVIVALVTVILVWF